MNCTISHLVLPLYSYTVTCTVVQSVEPLYGYAVSCTAVKFAVPVFRQPVTCAIVQLCVQVHRGTSLIRNCAPLGPSSETLPRALWKFQEGGGFFPAKYPCAVNPLLVQFK